MSRKYDLAERCSSAIPPSKVELLIAARIAEARKQLKGQQRPWASEGSDAEPVVAAATAEERSTLTFVEWVRFREPLFFERVRGPKLLAGAQARWEFEIRLSSYVRAWQNALPPAEEHEPQQRLFK